MSKRRPVSLVICSHENHVRIEWAMGLKGTMMPMGRAVTTTVIGGHSINDARNLAFESAFADKAEFLFMYDYDVIPRRQDALSRILAAMDLNPDVSVMGGVYPRRTRGEPEPIVIAEPDRGRFWNRTISTSYRTTPSCGLISPENSTSAQPNARPLPMAPLQEQYSPSSCHTPSTPRHPG